MLLICWTLQTMESRPVIPDRKLLARLVLIREEARNMMGGGILDERNDRGFNTLPESEVGLPLENSSDITWSPFPSRLCEIPWHLG